MHALTGNQSRQMTLAGMTYISKNHVTSQIHTMEMASKLAKLLCSYVAITG